MTLSPGAIEAALHEYITGDHNTAEQAMRSALTAALAVDGLCLVPKEPTDAMREAGAKFSAVCCAETGCIVGEVYRAMIAAANDGEEPK